ncbi:MAG: HNH endonuclease [Alphaproteobacteria bacterium]
MAKLSSLKPSISSLSSTIAYMPKTEQEHDRFRGQQHWRKWYNTARWKRLRWSILVRDGFTCQQCGRLEGNTALLVANHKKPHRGNELLFWDDGNLETACKPCHDGAIQREERRNDML